MECPLGLKTNGDEIFILEKCIYGHDQSEHQYYKKTVDILNKLRIMGGVIDPCLFVCKSSKGTVIIAFYVDDNLMIGDTAAIVEVIQQLKQKVLVLKPDDTLTNYLSCNIA